MSPDVSNLIAEQRLASQHYPSTWTEEAQFDLELWTWHDAHHKDSRYAACPPCLAEWADWYERRLKEKTAVYDLAKELGV